MSRNCPCTCDIDKAIDDTPNRQNANRPPHRKVGGRFAPFREWQTLVWVSPCVGQTLLQTPGTWVKSYQPLALLLAAVTSTRTSPAAMVIPDSAATSVVGSLLIPTATVYPFAVPGHVWMNGPPLADPVRSVCHAPALAGAISGFSVWNAAPQMSTVRAPELHA